MVLVFNNENSGVKLNLNKVDIMGMTLSEAQFYLLI